MPLPPARPPGAAPPGPRGPASLATGFRRRLAAGCGAFVVAAELVIAPVTLAGTVILLGIARLTRWPPAWLALPAVTGAGWALLDGPGLAVTGFAAGGAHLAGFVAASGSVPAHLARLPGAIARWRAGLSGQLPLALVASAVQAAIAGQVRGRIGPGGHRGRERAGGDGPPDGGVAGRAAAGHGSPYRPGLVCAARRAYLTATLGRGEVATVDGGSLGIEPDTGRRVSLSWVEAAGGVLVTGLDPDSVTRTGLELVVAAIQHRKAVIIVDLGRHPGPVAAAVAAACSECRAPLRTLSRAARPAHAAGQDPGLAGRARGPGKESGGGGAADAAGEASADPAGLARVLAGRQVLLAQAGSRAPEAAADLARQVADGLALALAGRRALGVPADCLAWINGCEQVGREPLSALLAKGRGGGGGAVVLGTTSGPTAGWLAGQAAVVVVRGRPPRDRTRGGISPSGRTAALAGRSPQEPAGRACDADLLAGEVDQDGPAGLPARLLAGQRDTDLSLLVRAPVRRLQTRCRAVR